MMRKTISLLLAGLLLGLLLACGAAPAGETGTEIVDAEEALELAARQEAVLVDVQSGVKYNRGHAAGAVNISRADIVVNEPFPNMLAPAEQIEEIFGSRGIGNDTLVIAYDDTNNMDAARLWWTLKVYGHHRVKVVSGGLRALQAAGAEMVKSRPSVTPVDFKAEPADTAMIAGVKEIRAQINEPDEAVVLVDTRIEEEYNAGTIPGSVLLNYAGNNFSDGTYRPVQQIRIRYLEEDIDYDKTVIMYCKTSIRGAQTYLALYNAGYRELKLYDGAWVEWSSNPINPIFKPEIPVYQIDSSDNS